MKEQDKGSESSRGVSQPTTAASPWASPEASAGRRERSAIPLSAGFGFGANRIREQAQAVARNAAERKESRVRELLNEPVYPAPAPTAIAAPETGVAPRPSAPMRIPTAARAMYAAPQPSPATRGRAFFAWILDGIVATSAFVIAMGANYALVPEGISAPLAGFTASLASILGSSNPYLFALVVRVLLSTMVLVFTGQMAVLLLTGSTAGRYAMGIFLRQSRWQRRLSNCFFAAVSEAVTVGGILTFPLLLLTPSRAPLASWVRYDQSE